jgi:formate hydrogenlyase subunit 3/multisubunit Na+/H+ antiporter MnhD subunit
MEAHALTAPSAWLAIDWMLAAIVSWLAIGMVGVVRPHNFYVVARVLFPLGAVVGLLLATAALVALHSEPETAVLPIGLPGLPFHLRLDALSAFFLLLLGATSTGISAFAAGYFRKGEGTPPGLLCLLYHLFLASMAMVLLADDAYAFMVMWELMALSSFFLVTANHVIPEIRRAGYLYLLVAHIGALAILLCFGVLQANTGDYTFANMRQQQLSPYWASVAFLLAFVGFGAKAGILPLHIWLPEAHPAAPSPVSALMSGVMLKTAIYGLLRVSFDILPTQLWWWGVLALAVGLATALFGVVFAAIQTDMKRLLAYSSIENIGLLIVGMGLALLFVGYGTSALAALALTAVLYHALNHAFFKSLLFLCTGAVLHATGERNLGKLGGLLRTMPWVGWLALAGALAAAGLPPLNGFVSEWLLLQSFLFTLGLKSTFVNNLVPVVAAGVALVAALGGYVMVKFFGVIFLGQPREPRLVSSHDAATRERIGLVWLAAGCVLLGLFPVQVIALLDPVTRTLVADGIGPQVLSSGWLFLAPVAPERASYSPLLFLLLLAACFALAFVLVRKLYHGRLRRAAPWDCGYPLINARMQDTAEGFGQPIRQVFEPFFRIERHLPTPFDGAPSYRLVASDHLWNWLYLPIARVTEATSRIVGLLQQGRISTYLMYSFVTLLVMLVLVFR